MKFNTLIYIICNIYNIISIDYVAILYDFYIHIKVVVYLFFIFKFLSNY